MASLLFLHGAGKVLVGLAPIPFVEYPVFDTMVLHLENGGRALPLSSPLPLYPPQPFPLPLFPHNWIILLLSNFVPLLPPFLHSLQLHVYPLSSSSLTFPPTSCLFFSSSDTFSTLARHLQTSSLAPSAHLATTTTLRQVSRGPPEAAGGSNAWVLWHLVSRNKRPAD